MLGWAGVWAVKYGECCGEGDLVRCWGGASVEAQEPPRGAGPRE